MLARHFEQEHLSVAGGKNPYKKTFPSSSSFSSHSSLSVVKEAVRKTEEEEVVMSLTSPRDLTEVSADWKEGEALKNIEQGQDKMEDMEEVKDGEMEDMKSECDVQQYSNNKPYTVHCGVTDLTSPDHMLDGLLADSSSGLLCHDTAIVIPQAPEDSSSSSSSSSSSTTHLSLSSPPLCNLSRSSTSPLVTPPQFKVTPVRGGHCECEE